MSTQPPLIQEPSIFLTVWDEAWAAISKPRYYVKWALQPLSRSISYACLLFTVMALVTTIYTVLTARPHWQAARAWITAEVPTVTMQDHQLSLENDKTFFFSDNAEVFIRVDTTDVLADVAIDSFYTVGLIVARDGVLLRMQDETSPITYKEFEIPNFSADGPVIADAAQTLVIAGVVAMPFFIFASMFISNMLYTAIFSLFVHVVSRFTITFKAVWAMSMYALTPSMLASYIVFVLYPLPYVSTIVFVVYMVMAVTYYRRFLDIRNKIA